MEHIAILSHKSVLDKILSGQKTVESRFSRLKSLPFGQINEGDKLYFKLSGGPVLGKAIVTRVEEYDNLTPGRVNELAKRYEKELAEFQSILPKMASSGLPIIDVFEYKLKSGA